MTTRDYRDLLDLMLDGVVYRKVFRAKPDPDADYVYSEIVSKLRRALPDAERDNLLEAVFTSLASRIQPPETFGEALERAR